MGKGFAARCKPEHLTSIFTDHMEWEDEAHLYRDVPRLSLPLTMHYGMSTLSTTADIIYTIVITIIYIYFKSEVFRDGDIAQFV